MNYKNKNVRSSPGFTIVELLIVIVIIGILAAITIVSYIGISKKATEASLTSDLDGAKRQLELYKTEHETYPTSLDENKCPTAPENDTKYCLKNKDFQYITTDNGLSYTLKLTKSDIIYEITNDSTPGLAAEGGLNNCPSGFVLVPGSVTYGTSNFCVMKYEAKNAGGNVPISTASGLPWADISQADAITYSANVSGCIGCHLISEAEWMTIAQNVLSVSGNWSSSTVGNGYVFKGHADMSPFQVLEASSSDADNYYGTDDFAGDAGIEYPEGHPVIGNSQRRTFELSNGGIIWDLSGNVTELTSAQISGGQPGGGSYTWREYSSLGGPGSLLVNVLPLGTGIDGSGAWNSDNNIGLIYSNSSDSALRGVDRGGSYQDCHTGGILSASFYPTASYSHSTIGFRVTAPAF